MNEPTMETTFPNARTMRIDIKVHSVVQLLNILGILASPAVQDNLKREAVKHFYKPGDT